MIAGPRAVVAVALLAGLCCGCASGLVNSQVPPPGSDAFQTGYLNGCRSGFEDAGSEAFEHAYAKDQERYASSSDYRTGWDRGHKACYEDEQRHPRMNFSVSRS